MTPSIFKLTVPNIFNNSFLEAIKKTQTTNAGHCIERIEPLTESSKLYTSYDIISDDPMFFYLLGKNYTIEKLKL